MRHVLTAASVSLVFLLLGVGACKGGAVDDPAEYRQAMRLFDMNYEKVKSLAHESRTRGDPQLLAQAFERLMPALQEMSSSAHGVKVAGEVLTPMHGDLVAAVDAYVNALTALNERVKMTPLVESKTILYEAGEELVPAVERWREELKGL